MTDRRGPDPWVLLPPVELVARVVSGPAPQMPLASIAHLLPPRHDAVGRIDDWALHASDLEHHDAVVEFRRWRATWRPEWPIGPISNLASLCDEIADIEHDLDRQLGPLLHRVVMSGGTGVPLTEASAQHLLLELETVRLAISVDDRNGSGIVDDMPTLTRSDGLARAWAPPRDEVLVTGTSTTTLVLRPGQGLVLVHHGAEHIVFPNVSAVDLRNDPAIILNDRGSSLRLPLDECRPLGWMVPRSLRWHLRPVPLVVVWAPLFQGLAQALRSVMADGGWIEITADAAVA